MFDWLDNNKNSENYDATERFFVAMLSELYTTINEFKQNLGVEYDLSTYLVLSNRYQKITEELDRYLKYTNDPLYEYINRSSSRKSRVQKIAKTSLEVATKFESYAKGSKKYSRVTIQRLLNDLLIQIESLADENRSRDFWQRLKHTKETDQSIIVTPKTGVEEGKKRGKVTRGLNADTKKLKVFLCHSSKDKPTVRELFNRLNSEKCIDAWLDEKKLLPGQEWDFEIAEAIRKTDVIIVCLSKSSVSKAGYVHKEISRALDVADEKPEGTIFIIPLKLEECDVPSRLAKRHWVNYFENDGYQRLMSSLDRRGKDLGLDITV